MSVRTCIVALVGTLLGLVGCGERAPGGVAEGGGGGGEPHVQDGHPFDVSARARLVARIAELGGLDEHIGVVDNPVVTLDEFFEGNWDPGSIGPNLFEHPGVEAFRRVFEAVAARPGVAGVYVRINAVEDEGSWPYSDVVYVYTAAPVDEVAKWVADLQPSEVSDGLCNADEPHPLAPKVPAGMRVVCVWWD